MCKNAYGSVQLHMDMVANVDSSDYICRRVDVYVRLSLEIYDSWQADYTEWPLHGGGQVTYSRAVTSRRVDGLALCCLDMVKIGWPLVNLIWCGRCGVKISFSPPLPLSLAEDWATAGVRRYRDDGDGLPNVGGGRYRDDGDGQGTRGIRRYRGNSNILSDWGYLFGRPLGTELRIVYLVWYDLISSHHTPNYTLHLSHLLISLAVAESPCWSMQLRGSSQLGSIIRSHPLLTLPKPELLFITNFFWRAARGAVECNDVLSAFQLHHFTTNGAETRILVRKSEYGMVGKAPTS